MVSAVTIAGVIAIVLTMRELINEQQYVHNVIHVRHCIKRECCDGFLVMILDIV